MSTETIGAKGTGNSHSLTGSAPQTSPGTQKKAWKQASLQVQAGRSRAAVPVNSPNFPQNKSLKWKGKEVSKHHLPQGQVKSQCSWERPQKKAL